VEYPLLLGRDLGLRNSPHCQQLARGATEAKPRLRSFIQKLKADRSWLKAYLTETKEAMMYAAMLELMARRPGCQDQVPGP